MPAPSAECNMQKISRPEELNQGGLPALFGSLARLCSPKKPLQEIKTTTACLGTPARSALKLTTLLKIEKQKINRYMKSFTVLHGRFLSSLAKKDHV